MKKYLLSTFAIVALLFAACGGGDDAPTTVPVSGIKLDKSSLSLEIGEKATLTATIAPSDATNKSITWSSANSSIATVNNGVVEGIATGETTITAKTNDGGFTASATVKVVTEKVPVEGIDMTYTRVIKEGQEGEITICFSPRNATNTNATIILSAPDVLSVEYKGSSQNPMLPSSWPCYTVKGLKAGTCNVTAVSEDGGFEYECTVTVLPIIKVTEINLWPTSAIIKAGQNQQFTATILPSNADNKEVEWSSSDTSIATVDANGLVTGVANGEATITATAKDGSGVKASTTITVVGEKPTSITVDGKNYVKRLTWHGKKIEIVPDMTPVSADLSTLTWTVSDWKTQNPCTSKIEAKKITVESNLSHYPYQFESVLNGTTIYGNNDRFDFTVYFRTHAIFSNHFEETKKRIDLSLPNTSIQISADLVELPYNVNAGTLYFEAYCPPIEYYASASPMWTQFPEAYIPTSEYTLTSSDETKWKVTKVSESTYKIEDLAPSTYKEIDLTYTCGEFSFTRKFKVVPK